MIKKLIKLCLSASLAVSVASCTKKNNDKENGYQFPIKSNVKGMDPIQAGDLYAGWVVANIYEGLMEYHYLKRPYQVMPALADGMPKISRDGLTYTFKIKSNVKFADDACFPGGKGRDVLASDFIYSWKRAADPVNNAETYWIFEGKIKGLEEWREAAKKSGKADYAASVEGLQAPDDHTLIVKLVRPYPQFLYVLTMHASLVVPHEAVDKYSAEFLNHPVGTGPFMLKEWQHNAKIVLVRNPNHRQDLYPSEGEPNDQANGYLADAGKQLPFVDKLTFVEEIEDQPRWLNFMKGVSDAAEIPKDNFDAVIQNRQLKPELANKGMQLKSIPDLDITYVACNMEDKVIGGYGEKQKNLRKAISLAIDSKEYGDKFFSGRYQIAEGPIPPGLNGYDQKLKNPYRQVNVEEAKKYLAKAGYPGGKGLPPLTYEVYSGTTSRQTAELVQANVQRIGVKLNINVSTWPEFREKLKKKKAQIWGVAWTADYPDAENFLQLLYGKNQSPGPNDANYDNPEYNKLYEKASVMMDTPERTAIYKKMVAIAQEDVPWVYNIHRELYYVTQGWLYNWKPAPELMMTKWKYLRVDTAKRIELKKKF